MRLEHKIRKLQGDCVKKTFLLFFLLALFSGSVYAGSELVGTTSSNFFKIPPFARAVGMGEAFNSLSEGTYGLYYNPAGLSAVPGLEFQATHISWFQDINYEFISMVFPVPFSDVGKLGAAFAWFNVGTMPRNLALPNDISAPTFSWSDYNNGTFSPYDYSIILGYGLDLSENLSSGITLKYTSENIANYNSANITGTLGVLYKTFFDGNYVRTGLTLENIGANMRVLEVTFAPPKILKLAISDTLLNNSLTFSLQSLFQFDYGNIYSLGAEYWLYNTVALRAGYKFGAFNQPSFGAGFKLNSFEFDYAFLNYSELGATHRFSALYAWGTPPVILTVAPAAFSPNRDNFMDSTFYTLTLKAPGKIKSAKVKIYDSTGRNLQAILPAGVHATNVPWNGLSQTGAVLPDGPYLAAAFVDYDNGTSISQPVSVEIHTTPPSMVIDAQPKLIKPGQAEKLIIPSTFSMSAIDKYNVANWQLAVYDSNKKLFFNTGGLGMPPPVFVWDGKSNAGEYVTTGQLYYYNMFSSDTLGNKGQTPLQAQVVLLREIKLLFASDALFEIGDANVKISAYHILKGLKQTTDKYPDSDILIGGYTDNLPPSGQKYPDNITLSKARAEAVKFFMVELMGFDQNRIKTTGWGEQSPIAGNDTEEGRLKNRRVEVTIRSTIYK